MLHLIAALLLASGPVSDAHQRGVQLYKQQKYVEAISTLEFAVKSEPPNSPQFQESVLLIGQSYFMLSQAPKAIPWLEKVPGSNEADYMLGYAYIQTNRADQSEAAFARLFQLKPDTAPAHLLAAQMLMKQEYEAQAATEANKALALAPKIPEAHYLLAEIAMFRGRVDEAIAGLQQELAVNPSFAMAWYRLGDAYTRQDRWDTAIPELERAIWLNPDYSGPYILLGKCYFKTANYSNAEGILRKALRLDPNNHTANYLLGQTLMAEGKTDEARAVLEKLKQMQGKK